MANENPIYLNADAQQKTFTIPEAHHNSMICLTLKVELVEAGWQFASTNTVFLDYRDHYPAKTPEPLHLNLAQAKNLDNKILDITTHVSRFRNGSPEQIPAKIRYTLSIEIGSTLVEEFSMLSDTKNPADFNAMILFKI